jgi:LuxR family maltose regulon positive regulatory protein
MHLIREKLAAPPLPPFVTRPRLLGALDESIHSRTSTILSGRTGTGKTVLAADFANRCGRRVAWYKVDASDVDPRLFFRYLFASMADQRPAFDSDALNRHAQSLGSDVSLLAEALVYELVEAGGEPLLTIIDDLHLVYDAEWFVPFFGRLLPLLPADVHFLVTGRSFPPAPLWRLRSKQMLCVVDEPVLAFTLPEALVLFEHYGLVAANAGAVVGETRGRATLLDAAARAMAARGCLA